MISKHVQPNEETENQKHVRSMVRSRNVVLMESGTPKTLVERQTIDLRNEPVRQPRCMRTLPYVIGEENVLERRQGITSCSTTLELSGLESAAVVGATPPDTSEPIPEHGATPGRYQRQDMWNVSDWRQTMPIKI